MVDKISLFILALSSLVFLGCGNVVEPDADSAQQTPIKKIMDLRYYMDRMSNKDGEEIPPQKDVWLSFSSFGVGTGENEVRVIGRLVCNKFEAIAKMSGENSLTLKNINKENKNCKRRTRLTLEPDSFGNLQLNYQINGKQLVLTPLDKSWSAVFTTEDDVDTDLEFESHRR